MASLLQKLLKKSPPIQSLRILASLTNSALANPPLHPSLHRDPVSNSSVPSPPDSFHQSLQIYPSFPHCFHWNPISQSGFDRCDDESDGDPGTVWADSVKKKRKRKMNKHKYRKLRKRLRRKT